MQAKDYHHKTSLSLLFSLVGALPIVGLFSGQFAATAFILVALFPTLGFLYYKPKNALYDQPINLWMIAGLAWALIAISWTITPKAAAGILWIKMLMVYVCSYALIHYLQSLTPTHKQKLFRILAGSFIAGLIITNIEIIFGSPITNILLALRGKEMPNPLIQLNRGAVILSLFLWPVMGFLIYQKKWPIALTLYVITGITLLRLESQTALLAHMVGGIIALAVYYLGRPALYVMLFGIGLVFILVPLSMYFYSPSEMLQLLPAMPGAAVEYRLHIWHFAVTQALEHPWLGWGFDASRNIPFTTAQMYNGHSPLPLHPHDHILQIWLELGIIGLVIFFGILAAFIQRIIRFTHPTQMICMTGCLATILVIGSTGFGIWQNWLICAEVLAAMLIYILPQPSTPISLT